MLKGGVGGTILNYNTKVVLFTKSNCNICKNYTKNLNINYDKYVDIINKNNIIYINRHNINKEEEKIWNIKKYPTIFIIRNNKIIDTLYDSKSIYKYLRKK